MRYNSLKKFIIYSLTIFTFYLSNINLVKGESFKNKKILYLGDFGVVEYLNPIKSNKEIEFHVCQFIFDSLITQNEKGDFIFSLAKNLDISADGLSYTFILKKNIRWSDGYPLTSKDVEFSIKLYVKNKSILSYYIEDVVCITPYIININLKKMCFSPLFLFTFKILPKHAYFNNIKFPIGCGPYKFLKLQNNRIILITNTFFNYRHSPFFKKIVLNIYQNQEKGVDDLINNKIYLLPNISSQYIKKIDTYNNEHIEILKYQEPFIHFIGFNYRRENKNYEFINNINFRKALTLAINKKEVLKKVFYLKNEDIKDSLITSFSYFNRDRYNFNNNLQLHSFDLLYARQIIKNILLKKGYNFQKKYWRKDGKVFSLRLVYLKDKIIEKICKKIKGYIEKLGIKVILKGFNYKRYIKEVWKKHNFDLAYVTWKPINIEMDLDYLLSPKRINSTNFCGYFNSNLVELFFKIQNTLNPWKLRSIYFNIHKYIHNNYIFIFLWQLKVYLAYNKRLKNLKFHPYFLFNFSENWKLE